MTPSGPVLTFVRSGSWSWYIFSLSQVWSQEKVRSWILLWKLLAFGKNVFFPGTAPCCHNSGKILRRNLIFRETPPVELVRLLQRSATYIYTGCMVGAVHMCHHNTVCSSPSYVWHQTSIQIFVNLYLFECSQSWHNWNKLHNEIKTETTVWHMCCELFCESICNSKVHPK